MRRHALPIAFLLLLGFFAWPALAKYIFDQSNDGLDVWVGGGYTDVHFRNSTDVDMTAIGGALRAPGIIATSTTLSTFLVETPQGFTIPDSGGAGAATSSATPTASRVDTTCSDADGCEWTIGETAMADGTALTVINVGTNLLSIMDSSGVVELDASQDVVLRQYDWIELAYEGGRWVGGKVFHAGGTYTGITEVSSTPYALLETDVVVLVDASGGDVTVNLPACSTFTGRKVLFKNVGGANQIILDADGTDQVDGAGTYQIDTAASGNRSVGAILSDGVDDWWVF